MEHRSKKSLELWERYGEYVLMAMPYGDDLIAEARGSTFQDLDGKETLDMAAGQFCSILGACHPTFTKRLIEQMTKVVHTGTQFLTPIVLEASAKFAEIAPGSLKRALFLSTGTEADECAISLAKTYTGKSGVIGFNRGYYGLSLGTKSLTSIFSPGDGHGSGPTVPGSVRFLAPHCFHCPVRNHYPECDFVCLDSSVETCLSRHADIAAIVLEPIMSAGGMIIPPPGYLKRLKQLAHRLGALLIVDEAQTGFGRTGKWFACEHHDIEPDILVVSKGAGAGFPASGVITTDEIADRVADRGWIHLASHQSDPLAAAAVAATIDIVRDEKLIEKAAADGLYLLNRLRELKDRQPLISDVRGQGLMVGAEIGSGSGEDDHQLKMKIVALCEQKGVHFTYTYFEPVIRFLPPLTITRQEIDCAIEVLQNSIAEVVNGDVSAESLVPSNPYSREFVQKLSGKKTMKRMAQRLYETSPKYWLDRLRGNSTKT